MKLSVPCRSHYIGENRSDIRGIKQGWYAIEDAANFL